MIREIKIDMELLKAVKEQKKHANPSWYSSRHGEMINHIYFILDETNNAVKIGITARNIQIRKEEIEKHNVNLIKILKTIKIGQKARTYEKKIHEIFKEYCIKYEWFKYEGALKEFIERL